MVHLHVLVQLGCKHKCSSAVGLLASQLWRSVSTAEVILKLLLPSELLDAPLLHTAKTLFFEVHILDMIGQTGCGFEHSSAVGLLAS